VTPVTRSKRSAEQIKRDLAIYQARSEQLNKAIYAWTMDGVPLLEYLKNTRSARIEQRARLDPENIRENTEFFARIDELDRIISEWEQSKQLNAINSNNIKVLQKELDKLQGS